MERVIRDRCQLTDQISRRRYRIQLILVRDSARIVSLACRLGFDELGCVGVLVDEASDFGWEGQEGFRCHCEH